MSNLRIKYKKLKRENERLERLCNTAVKPYNIISNSHNVVRLRSSLQLTEEEKEKWLPQCVDDLKYTLLKEVKEYIKIKPVGVDLNNPELPSSMLLAELSIVKED